MISIKRDYDDFPLLRLQLKTKNYNLSNDSIGRYCNKEHSVDITVRDYDGTWYIDYDMYNIAERKYLNGGHICSVSCMPVTDEAFWILVENKLREHLGKKKIWFRIGMEAEITEEEYNTLLIYSGQLPGERDCRAAHAIMQKMIATGETSGETYIVGKNCGGVEDYDNPEEEINFLF